MKIVAIIESPRRGSYNCSVFEYYRKLVGPQTEFIEGKLDDFPLYNDDIRENARPESVIQLAEQIRSADGVIFFSPEYNYSVSAPLGPQKRRSSING